ncbi:MAG TPA: zinc dependent phospholipase C family protein [Bryobacteraceae bacterium]|jgi:hypothetical protein|nr:zinc dependent phospholipase C family protein [Bryobacteraceae bacterium]
MIRAAIVFILAALPCAAYSALSHEAVIDSAWSNEIVPLLTRKFPGATADDLKRAHAYAYGGAQIQDMGYFPFSSHAFSDLTHYVRSGDFVQAMLGDAQSIEEYAFALGALAHYASDNTGHPAVNRATGMIYRDLRRKYGAVVTYEDDPADHLKTEFSFDVIQVARGLYASDNYHDFIGFEVSKPLLERAFRDTYGIDLKEIFGSLDLGIGTYRFTLGKVIPEMTKVAWDSKRADIEKLAPGITRSRFVYALPRARYEKNWDRTYRRPGFFTRLLAFVFRFIPTVGPFKVLRFKPVPDSAERAFLKSFDATVADYRALIQKTRAGAFTLPNTNLDTGEPTQPDRYRLADRTYALWLDHLSKGNFASLTPEMRANLEKYFARANRARLSEKTIAELEQLKSVPSRAGGN